VFSHGTLVLVTCLWFAVGAVSPPLSLAADKNACGLVIGLTGEWKMGDRTISLGDKIARVNLPTSPLPTTPTGTVTVWFVDEKPTLYSCEGESCHITTSTCDKPKDSSRGLVARLFGEEPKRYFTAASRGLDPDLKEAVLSLSGSQVDIAAAMTDLSPGVYWVRFESLHGDGVRTKPAQVQWHAAKPAVVSAIGLRPGVYRLSLLEESGDPMDSDAWILVSKPSEYSTVSMKFHEVVNTVAAWPAETDPTAIRAVLRASLEALADEDGSTKP